MAERQPYPVGDLEYGQLVQSTPPDIQNSTTLALAASRIIKSQPGTLYGMTVTNSNAAAQYIQLFDTGGLPANGVVPIMGVPVAGDSVLFLEFGIWGRKFQTGIVVCNSTTQETKTIGSADCLFDAQYT